MKNTIPSGALALLALLLATGACAQSPLRVVTFRGSSFWPAMVAVDKGYYGPDARLTLVPNSIPQMVGMAKGEFDLAFTLIDNVIAYNEGQGEAKVEKPTDLVEVFGLTANEATLVTLPEVKTVDQLKGRQLAVDALTTGNSYILMEMLRRLGLGTSDYTLVSVGGANLRDRALEERKQAGTIPSSPAARRLVGMGFNNLGDSVRLIGRLEGLVGAVSRSWAAANEDRVVELIRGTARSVAWLQDPANGAEAVTILRKFIPETTPEAAEAAFKVVPREWRRDLAIDLEGVRNTMEIRARFAQPPRALTDASRYVDTRYHQKAMAR